MRTRKTSVALATMVAALAGASAFGRVSAREPYGPWWGTGHYGVDAASAQRSYGRGGGPAQYDDSGLFMYGARSPTAGIPQAMPGSKMNRGAMGAPTMRGSGGMRGQR